QGPPSVVKVTRTVFDGNQVTATGSASSAKAEGGAVEADLGTQLAHLMGVTMSNSTVLATRGLKATARSRGMRLHGSMAMRQSTVSGNSAHAHAGSDAGGAAGGGIEFRGPGRATISTSTVSDNTTTATSDQSGSGASGGGIDAPVGAGLTLATSS